MKAFLKRHLWSMVSGLAFCLFVAVSMATGYVPGKEMGKTFAAFLWQMLKVLPCVFVLIGLFDVWIKRETVQKHLGRHGGLLSYVWSVLLAGTMIGGLHVALPVAQALYVKRARLTVILTFLSAAAICRVPMAVFEASFLGWRFTVVRLAVSLPLTVVFSAGLGAWFVRRGYELPDLDGDGEPGEQQ